MFLIQEECYHGKPGGLSIGELPSGSLDDQGLCLLQRSLLFGTAVPLLKLSFELVSWKAQKQGGEVASGTWHVTRHGEQCHNLQMLCFVESSIVAYLLPEGEMTVGSIVLTGWLILLSDTMKYAHRSKQSSCQG